MQTTNFQPDPGYPDRATDNVLRLSKLTTTSYTPIVALATPAQKALLFNAGSGDISLSVNGSVEDRVIPSQMEYEWSNPDGNLNFDLAGLFVNSAVAGQLLNVLYR